ncbi:type II toxin-antitoxin system HipA family toxin [Pseudotabrizicola sediminis]|uniref:Type II toxin-antitoxin system HipA family toxin n=1 Tax=Pseudotabrizicola sediminis TaxID=2486418 RepID=A0ABY2KTB1_9RHOB|nr:type II toxin-antitoxin system HipA family toxin [Pseudotabrizicola sediminis]TGD44735.1 type II toxin-antitoxin system HipA family toxin [Pseudotabrizicola sediminis]
MTRRLLVSLEFDDQSSSPVGTMGWDAATRQAVVEWDTTFAAQPLPLSPLLVKSHNSLLRPQGRAFGDLPGLFGDSLPDGWGRLLIDRELAARGRRSVDISDMDRLAMIGRAGMGALTYRPEVQPDAVEEISLDWFDRLVPKVGGAATADDLERLRMMAGGSQGARPKFVAQLSDDGSRLRSHRMTAEAGWRHVLVKRRALSDSEGAVEAESAYATMARAAGINMTPVQVIRATSGEPFFVTDRFDRDVAQRLHMQTVAALLDVDFRTATLDYIELMKVVRLMTRDQRAVEEMFRRMVFNIRTLNRDDHLKNHAFLMDKTGSWSLAPAYDLSFSSGPGGEHTLLVAGEGRRPGRVQINEVAAKAGIKPKRAAAIVEEVDNSVARWLDVADKAEVPAGRRTEILTVVTEALNW